MKLYKYRTLSNFKWLIDIFINNRLYAATFDEFKDTMEGHYYSYGVPDEIIYEMRNEKKQARICSLCKSNVIQEMWQEYADDGRGLCLQVKTKGRGWKKFEIPYKNDLLHYDDLNEPKQLNVLLYKLKGYAHEAEVRYIKFVKPTMKKKLYLPIIIEKIFLGYEMPDDDKKMIRTLVEHLNKNGSNIMVDVIKRNKIKSYKLI